MSSVSREKYMLVLGRAFCLASKDAEEKPRYTTTSDSCTCPAFVKNEWFALAETHGQKVEAYPGVTCKHVLEQQLRDGLLTLESMGDLTDADRELMQAGFAHQTRMDATSGVMPTGVARGRAAKKRVAAIKVTASDGHVIDFGNRTAKEWHFSTNGLEPQVAKAKAEGYFGDGFTVEVANVSEGWVKTELPVS